MNKREVSLMLDGDTFVGRYRVSEHNRVSTVSVQYGSHALSARLNDRSEEHLARALLGELVRAQVATEMPKGLAA